MKKACTECNRSGFTLVELLVVVAIIAILSVIGLTIFSGAQANARDTRRKADIDAIAKVLETSRTPGTVYYISLLKDRFSGGAIPIDTGTPQYVYKTSTSAVPADPTIAGWAATAVTPTGAAPNDGWTAITNVDITFTANTIAWKVCARLESSTIFCKPSAQ